MDLTLPSIANDSEDDGAFGYARCPNWRCTLNEVDWLRGVQDRIERESPSIQVTWPDEKTLGAIVRGNAVVITAEGTRGYLARSVSSGTTLEARLASPVRHLDPLAFLISEKSADECAAAAMQHLDGIQP